MLMIVAPLLRPFVLIGVTIVFSFMSQKSRPRAHLSWIVLDQVRPTVAKPVAFSVVFETVFYIGSAEMTSGAHLFLICIDYR